MRFYVIMLALIGCGTMTVCAKGPKEQVVTFFARKTPDTHEYIKRKGILVIRPNAKATILALHGYSCNKVDAGFLRLMFPDYNFMVFDFRAHGEDVEGQLSTLGHDEVYDVFGAVDYLRTRPDTKDVPIIGYGFSMGASTAIEALSQDSTLFAAGIFDCPFEASQDIIHRGFDKLKIKVLGYEFDIPGRSYIEKYAFNPYVQPIIQFFLKYFARMDASLINTLAKPISPKESIKKIDKPALFVICAADKTVPVKAVEEIYANAPCYKRLWITDGSRHYGSVFHDPESYQKITNDFIKGVLDGTYKEAEKEKVLTNLTEQQIEAKQADESKIAGLYG